MASLSNKAPPGGIPPPPGLFQTDNLPPATPVKKTTSSKLKRKVTYQPIDMSPVSLLSQCPNNQQDSVNHNSSLLNLETTSPSADSFAPIWSWLNNIPPTTSLTTPQLIHSPHSDTDFLLHNNTPPYFPAQQQSTPNLQQSTAADLINQESNENQISTLPTVPDSRDEVSIYYVIEENSMHINNTQTSPVKFMVSEEQKIKLIDYSDTDNESNSSEYTYILEDETPEEDWINTPPAGNLRQIRLALQDAWTHIKAFSTFNTQAQLKKNKKHIEQTLQVVLQHARALNSQRKIQKLKVQTLKKDVFKQVSKMAQLFTRQIDDAIQIKNRVPSNQESKKLVKESEQHQKEFQFIQQKDMENPLEQIVNHKKGTKKRKKRPKKKSPPDLSNGAEGGQHTVNKDATSQNQSPGNNLNSQEETTMKFAKIIIFKIPMSYADKEIRFRLHQQLNCPLEHIIHERSQSQQGNVRNSIFKVPQDSKQSLLQQHLQLHDAVFRVASYMQIRKCGRCQSFEHATFKCKEPEEFCSHCAGNHHFSKCTKDAPLCINCKMENSLNHYNYETNHPAYSPHCPIYQKTKNFLLKRHFRSKRNLPQGFSRNNNRQMFVSPSPSISSKFQNQQQLQDKLTEDVTVPSLEVAKIPPHHQPYQDEASRQNVQNSTMLSRQETNVSSDREYNFPNANSPFQYSHLTHNQDHDSQHYQSSYYVPFNSSSPRYFYNSYQTNL